MSSDCFEEFQSELKALSDETEEFHSTLRALEEFQSELKALSDETEEFHSTLRALIVAGKLADGIHLMINRLKNIAYQSENKQLLSSYKAVESLGGLEDIWRLTETLAAAQVIPEEAEFERALLEMITAVSYSALAAAVTMSSYNFTESERAETQKAALHRRQVIISTFGNLPNLDQAFQLFRKGYRRLAEIYDDCKLLEGYITFDKSSGFDVLHEHAKKLVENYRDQNLRRQLLLLMVRVSSERIPYYGRIGEVAKAEALYDEVRHTVEEIGNEMPETLYAQAKAAVNMIYCYVTARKPDEAQVMYNELKEIINEAYRESSRLRFAQANRAADLVYAYALADRYEEARVIYEEIRELVKRHPNEPRLRIWQAEGALDLASVYANTGNREKAGEVLQELNFLVREDLIRAKVEKRKAVGGMSALEKLRELLSEP